MRKTVALVFMLLTIQAISTETQSRADSQVVARVDGQAITIAEVDARAGGKLFRLRAEEYGLRRNALLQIIEERLFALEAAKSNVTIDALLLGAGISPNAKARESEISDVEIESILRVFPERYQTVPREVAVSELRRKLADERFAARTKELATALRSKHMVTVALQPPRAEVQTNDRPTLGDSSAPVTLVVFSDFQCPYCARIAPVLKAVVKENPGRVKLVFKDFPLPSHKEAGPAARAAACADAQGRFWEYHDILFARQQELSASTMFAAATHVGLEMNRFDLCFKSSDFDRRSAQDFMEGTRIGILGTPTVFVNGRMVPTSKEEIDRAIAEELSARTTPATSSQHR